MIYTNSTTNYTNIDTQKSVHFAVSRTETRLKCIRLVYEILVICRVLQALYTPQRCELINQKQITLIVPIGYSLFADHRSVPSSGPGFVCLTIFCLSRVRVHRFRDNAVTGDIPLIHQYLNQWYPLSTWYRMSGTSGIYYFWLPDRLCSSPPLLGFYWNRWGGGGKQRCLRPQCLQFTNNTYTI